MIIWPHLIVRQDTFKSPKELVSKKQQINCNFDEQLKLLKKCIKQ
jgi:hypothetical protein